MDDADLKQLHKAIAKAKRSLALMTVERDSLFAIRALPSFSDQIDRLDGLIRELAAEIGATSGHCDELLALLNREEAELAVNMAKKRVVEIFEGTPKLAKYVARLRKKQ